MRWTKIRPWLLCMMSLSWHSEVMLPHLGDILTEDLEPLSTPFYLYTERHLETLWSAYQESLGAEVKFVHTHFALKSNTNPDVLKFFLSKNCGVDLVSGFELEVAKSSGFASSDMIFSGVGKSRGELRSALKARVDLIVVESEGELQRLEECCAELGTQAQIAFRVNPDVDAKSHPYISTGLHEHKFGIDFNEAQKLATRLKSSPHLKMNGISVHIGSQMLDLSALASALKLTLDFAKELKVQGHSLKILDVGGGLGVPYSEPQKLPPFSAYGKLVAQTTREWQALQGSEALVYNELGRALVAQAGFLVTRVLGTKSTLKKNFLIVDASMTELLRPALYQAVHPMGPLRAKNLGEQKNFDVVGPVCESSDVLGRDRSFTSPQENDFFVIEGVGAYGYVMASHYNCRPIPAEYFLNKSGQLLLSRAPRLFS